MIYDQLTREEYAIFVSFKESTSDIQIYFALRARYKNIPKKIIRKILENIDLPRRRKISREEYNSLKQIHFQLKKETNPPIEKPKPYSGYSKGYRDGKSSKRKFRVEEYSSSPVETSPIFEDEIKILIGIAREIERNPRMLDHLFTYSESQDESRQ